MLPVGGETVIGRGAGRIEAAAVGACGVHLSPRRARHRADPSSPFLQLCPRVSLSL